MGDGYWRFRQTHPLWRNTVLEKDRTIGQSGCALTAAAIVLSKLAGKPINPAMLDAHLDAIRGYTDNSLNWIQAASIVPGVKVKYIYTRAEIDAELAAGRGVVCGVDYKRGASSSDGKTDHWIVITAVKDGVYTAIDPITAKYFKMHFLKDGRLDAITGIHNYKSTGAFRAFSRITQ